MYRYITTKLTTGVLKVWTIFIDEYKSKPFKMVSVCRYYEPFQATIERLREVPYFTTLQNTSWFP
jgi:hypothetical protein